MKYALINEIKITPVTIEAEQPGGKAVCAGGFLVKKNKFLFGKRSRSKDWAPGLWDIVGGHSLKNEHPMFTLQRETWEETGVNVLNAELMITADVASADSGETLFRYHIYIVTHFKGKPFNKSKEHTKLKWFTRAALDNIPLALEEYRTLIDEWLAKNMEV